MDCKKAIDLLSGYVVGDLSDYERAQLVQHLGEEGHSGGCSSCLQELDALTAAASLLAESVPSVAPRPQLKVALLERIDSEQRCAGTSNLPNKPLVTKHGWQSYLPYIAATLFAAAAGAWVARYADSPENSGVDEWRRQIAATEQAFGTPRIQLAKLETGASGQDLAVAVFYDGLSGEYHILVSNVDPPSQDRKLWLWLVDRQGARLSQGPLEYLGQGHAAGVLRQSAKSEATPEMVSEVIITDEPPGNPTKPTGPVVGQAQRI